jgi:hypothetical protein
MKLSMTWREVSSDEKRAMLRHFLAALAYRMQKALRDAPAGFGEFSAGERTRTPRELVRHTSILGPKVFDENTGRGLPARTFTNRMNRKISVDTNRVDPGDNAANSTSLARAAKLCVALMTAPGASGTALAIARLPRRSISWPMLIAPPDPMIVAQKLSSA